MGPSLHRASNADAEQLAESDVPCRGNQDQIVLGLRECLWPMARSSVWVLERRIFDLDSGLVVRKQWGEISLTLL